MKAAFLSFNKLIWPAMLLAAMPLNALAVVDSVANNKTPTNILGTTNLITVFGSLVLVFACIFGLVYLLKRINGLPAKDRNAIAILGSRRIGSREKIILIEVGEQQLLIGATPNSICTLHVYGSPIDGLSNTPAKGLDFSSLMGLSASSEKV